MIKILSTSFILQKTAQSFLDEVRDSDAFDDKNDTQQGYGIPGWINNENYQDFLADDLNDYNETEEKPQGEPLLPGEYLQKEELSPELPQQQEQPEPEENKVTYVNGRDLVYSGIDNGEIVSFDYTNRYGMYCGYRTVEPHYTFIAPGTGNEIVVTYDFYYGIRAFIINNIHPYGVRYKDEKFKLRPAIMQGVL